MPSDPDRASTVAWSLFTPIDRPPAAQGGDAYVDKTLTPQTK